MIYLQLAFEFFKIGLFSIGGGMATLPFLMDLTKKYNWYTASELANIVAISESTPGPVGVNMATYAGYNAAGIPGALIATLSLTAPALIIIIIIARFLENFSENPTVKAVFYGIRPTVAALIGYAVWELLKHARHSHKWCDKDQLLESCLMHHFLRAYADQKTGKTSPAVLDRCRSRSRYYLPALNG